jgi:hypothetical protein
VFGSLCRAIYYVCRGSAARAIGATEKLRAYFHAVADHAALAVLADGRHGLDGALKTVEGVPCPGGLYIEGFIVVISADFALWH